MDINEIFEKHFKTDNIEDLTIESGSDYIRVMTAVDNMNYSIMVLNDDTVKFHCKEDSPHTEWTISDSKDFKHLHCLKNLYTAKMWYDDINKLS